MALTVTQGTACLTANDVITSTGPRSGKGGHTKISTSVCTRLCTIPLITRCTSDKLHAELADICAGREPLPGYDPAAQRQEAASGRRSSSGALAGQHTSTSACSNTMLSALSSHQMFCANCSKSTLHAVCRTHMQHASTLCSTHPCDPVCMQPLPMSCLS